MTPKLQKMRDELAEEYFEEDGPGYLGNQVYGAGFEAAHDLLMPVIEEMRAALEYHTHSDDVGYPNDNVIEALEKAREILE